MGNTCGGKASGRGGTPPSRTAAGRSLQVRADEEYARKLANRQGPGYDYMEQARFQMAIEDAPLSPAEDVVQQNAGYQRQCTGPGVPAGSLSSSAVMFSPRLGRDDAGRMSPTVGVETDDGDESEEYQVDTGSYVAADNAASEVRECSVCMDPLSAQDVSSLECAHVFHSACVAEWIKKSMAMNNEATCPECSNAVAPPVLASIKDQMASRRARRQRGAL
eukprot:Rhum_TRINITY_DN4933_c0_g2::Rhum_TRINITY_DN4933_c0_g2_i1::g.16122::m.16122